MILVPGLNIMVFGPDEDDKSDKFISKIKSYYKFDTTHFHYDNGIGVIDNMSISKDNEEKQTVYIYDARSKWSNRGLKCHRTEICNQILKSYNDALYENVILIMVIDAEYSKTYKEYIKPLPYMEYVNSKTIFMSTVILVSKDDRYDLIKHRYIESKDYREFSIDEILKGEN